MPVIPPAGTPGTVTMTSPAPPEATLTPGPWKSMRLTPDRTTVFSSCTSRFGVAGRASSTYGLVLVPPPETSIPSPAVITQEHVSEAQPHLLVGINASPGSHRPWLHPRRAAVLLVAASHNLMMKLIASHGGITSNAVPDPVDPELPAKLPRLTEWKCPPAPWIGPDRANHVPPPLATRELVPPGLSADWIEWSWSPTDEEFAAPWSWLIVWKCDGMFPGASALVAAPPMPVVETGGIPGDFVADPPIGNRSRRSGTLNVVVPSPP